MESEILKIVKEQSKYTDQEARDIEFSIQEFKHQNEQKARAQMNQDQSIGNCIEIPSNLKSGELNQTHEVHPHFKDYDHSLEAVRHTFSQPESDPSKPKHVEVTNDEPLKEGEFGINWGDLAGKLGL